MTTPQHKDTHRHPVRGDQESAARSRTRERKGKEVCKECRGDNAFQAWHDQTLTPSFNWLIDFADWGIIKPGTRAVIELVTATITVPAGEWARLRLYTSLGTTPSNLDLFLNPQGLVGGSQIYVATHSLRVYSDEDISFNVNRDNATTSGEAFICISGYLIDV